MPLTRLDVVRRNVSITVITVFSAISAAAQTKPEEPRPVSVIQLIATPEQFEGKLVSVFGFLHIEHEGDLLYLNKADYDNVILTNALWVDVTEDMGKNRANLNLKYVKIIGRFKSGNKQRNPISVGGLTEIRSCEPWSDPANPLENRIRAMHPRE